jgi:hypothetical protein
MTPRPKWPQNVIDCTTTISDCEPTKDSFTIFFRVVASSRQLIESDQSSFDEKDGESKSKINPGCLPNPWSIRCHKREMDKMRTASSGPGPKSILFNKK